MTQILLSGLEWGLKYAVENANTRRYRFEFVILRDVLRRGLSAVKIIKQTRLYDNVDAGTRLIPRLGGQFHFCLAQRGCRM